MSRWLRAAGIVDGDNTPLVKTPKTVKTPSKKPDPEVLGVLQVLTRGVSRASAGQEGGSGGFEGFDEAPFDDRAGLVADRFEERSAILQHDEGLSRSNAESLAAREEGFADAHALRSGLCLSWEHSLSKIQDADLTRQANECVRNAIAFINEGWAIRAFELGWTEAELVWADVRAPWARLDNIGAAYLARRIEKVTTETIVCGVAAGSPLNIRRARGDGRVAPPWLGLEVLQ